MRHLIFYLGFGFLLIGTLSPAQTIPRQGKDFALFFAVKDYAEWSDLRNPIRDAEAIAGELAESYGFDTVILRNPSRNAIRRKLIEYQNKVYPVDAQLFVYFSGHGDYRSRNDKDYFIPQDGKRDDDFADSHLDHSNIEGYLSKTPCKHILLTIDACYSGTFSRLLKGRGNRLGENQKAPWIANQFKDTTRLFFTSGGVERTSDGTDHSPLTRAILRGLRKEKTEGYVSASRLATYFEGLTPIPRYGEFKGNAPGSEFLFIAPTDSSNFKYPIEPSIIPEMVLIEGGIFQMGSEEGDDDEKPIHTVTLSNYYIGKTELTVAEFERFITETSYQTTADVQGSSFIWTGSTFEYIKGVNWTCDVKGNPRPRSEYNHPVIHVSWYDAARYCNWQSQKEGYAPYYIFNGETSVSYNSQSKGYRLPSEAQWEFAARGGNKGKDLNHRYSGGDKLADLAWYDENSNDQTHPVAQKSPNALGLYDMSGNVWEWCDDWYAGYPSEAYRVARGGSWVSFGPHCGVAIRINPYPDNYNYGFGFRLSRLL